MRACGLSPGTTGNISVRVGAHILATPTGSDLGSIHARSLAVLAEDGRLIAGQPPSKEWPMHVALYEAASVSAVAHSHQTFATALSCLEEVGAAGRATVPILTPYLSMRAAPLEVVDYLRPGSPGLGDLLRGDSSRPRIILMRNHGAVAAAASLDDAITLLVELEESAKIYFATRGVPVRPLTAAQVIELQQ
ncbi:MAG: class aldolase/adducin-like [Glaciihabitans sp.]|nr:class aldolase/adducin-like [Glaciihabitans sp.]